MQTLPRTDKMATRASQPTREGPDAEVAPMGRLMQTRASLEILAAAAENGCSFAAFASDEEHAYFRSAFRIADAAAANLETLIDTQAAVAPLGDWIPRICSDYRLRLTAAGVAPATNGEPQRIFAHFAVSGTAPFGLIVFFARPDKGAVSVESLLSLTRPGHSDGGKTRVFVLDPTLFTTIPQHAKIPESQQYIHELLLRVVGFAWTVESKAHRWLFNATPPAAWTTAKFVAAAGTTGPDKT